MAEVTLRDALESIETGGSVKERNAGLANLKHILRYNQNSSQVHNLNDKSFHIIFETLFNVAVTDQSNFVKAKTKTTQSTAANKLSEVASALRGAVEAGVQTLKFKTAIAVLDHICDTIYLANGDFCEPLALDYAKCMRAIFSYQPHVEHLNREHDAKLKSWGHYARFCINFIKKAEIDLVGEDALASGDFISTAATINGLSYRSTSSVNRDSLGSQSIRSVIRPVAEEMLACVRLLTAAPNAPLKGEASPLLSVIMDALRTSAISSRSHTDAFAAISHIISWSRTEDVVATQKVISHLVRLVKQLWPQSAAKSSAATSHMLSVILLLKPYIVHAMRQPAGVAVRAELMGLLRGLQSEYSKRHERDQLKLDDIRLEINPEKHQHGRIATRLFTLRCSGGRAECNWLLAHILAFLHEMTMEDEDAKVDQDSDREVVRTDGRPSKRQRLEDTFVELLERSTSGVASSRSCALQVLAFLAQQVPLTCSQLSKALDRIAISCGEENGLVSSWAFVAASACASRLSATDSELSARWNALWQLASRSLSNASSCRGASFALYAMVQLRLVSQSHVSELIQTITRAMDLNGPALFSDAAALLLQTVLKASQENSPASASAVAESTISWLSHVFTPGRIDDKQFVANTAAYDASDIVALVCFSLNFTCHTLRSTGLTVWDVAARAWIFCEADEQLVSYLLLNPPVDSKANGAIEMAKLAKETSIVQPRRSSCEALLLTHLLSELTKINEVGINPRQLSADAFAMLCKAATSAVCLAHCNTFRDTRRQTQTQAQASKLLHSIQEFVASGECDPSKADNFLTISSASFSKCNRQNNDTDSGHETWPKCETITCRAIQSALSRRAGLNSQNGDDDGMDLDETQDSQDSRQGPATSSSSELTNDLDVAYSKLTLRSSATLYATALVMMEDSHAPGNNVPLVSTQVTDFLLSQPEDFILSSRDVVSSFSELGLILSAKDTYRLLEYFLEGLLKKRAHSMSEVALGTVLDIMSSLIGVWTDSADQALYELGLDAYDWFAGFAMNGHFLSPNVLKRLSTLLLDASKVNPEYGRGTEAGTAWTCLFSAIPNAPVVVQYRLAACVPGIFGSFVLGDHEKVFGDLLGNLPDDVTSLEGIALRLWFLSNLASWRSLLRKCVYYIFEVAGRAEGSTEHSAHCIRQLARSLPLMTPQRLFTLFSPQLLHTWFDTKEALDRLPFAAFEYKSLHDLLRVNQAEVLAQLTMRGDEAGMNLMSKALKTCPADAIKRSYARCVAYCIAHDVSTKQTGGSNSPVEERLRTLIGGKAEHNKLIQEHFPTIVGQFYLTIQQDDPKDSWLEKREGFGATWQALTEMKNYSHSDSKLPDFQEPSFKGKYLGDELERLCRRLATAPHDCWTPSTFALTVRILLDSVDESLGSLHSALMIRRLRILIATAGGVATDGYALETLIHSLRPFLRDSECSDDVLGILHYLFKYGKSHLRMNMAFTAGAVTLLVVEMRKHARTQHDRTTQESQHTATVQKMLNMQKWLVSYLVSLGSVDVSPAYQQLTDALGRLRLPGNAISGSAESTLLLLLLGHWSIDRSLCSRADSIELLSLLSVDFETTVSLKEDCLSDDGEAARYAQALWEAIGVTSLTDDFMVWAAGVLGRAYASTGLRPARVEEHNRFHVRSIANGNHSGTTNSKAKIAEHLCRTLYSTNRAEAGLAEFTLRKIHEGLANLREAEESIEFQQLLPDTVYAAVYDGNFGYEPTVRVRPDNQAAKEKLMESALQLSSAGLLESWATSLATAICNWSTVDATVSSLGPLIQNVEGLALELLPSMIHILLAKEHGCSKTTLRTLLSSAASAFLADTDPDLRPRQQFFLEVVLYLKSQPYPEEKTKADRIDWLDVDFMVAAAAASRCGMPACALMLAESAAPESVATMVQSSRRSSSRVSLSQQIQQPRPPDELLMSIYQQMEEPDSFYGVQQEASLESVLGRLDHEADGFRSLMFRSAQMDSHMRHSHQMAEPDAIGMVQSLSTLSFNGLAFALVSRGIGDSKDCSMQMMNAAQSLQQWDIAPVGSPEASSATFSVFQELSRTGEVQQIREKSYRTILEHVKSGLLVSKGPIPTSTWFSTLASLTEINEITTAVNEAEMVSGWQVMLERQDWMHMARFEDVEPLLTCRQTLFGVLSQNGSLQKKLRLSQKQCRAFEVEALLSSSKFAREHSRLQEALAATTTLSDMVGHCKDVGLNIEIAVKVDTATVLWDAGETTVSVKLLKDALTSKGVAEEAFPVGRSGLLAQLGHELAEARLEKPEGIYSDYLKPAISQLKHSRDQVEIGKVHHEFAVFCDKELQNPGNIENLDRIAKLRQGKQDEIEAIQQAIKTAKKTGADRGELSRSLGRANQWLEIDTAEENRLKESRDQYVQQSLQNYLFALKASDEHDISVLRFFALWLENSGNDGADGTVLNCLPQVPSWKFVRLMNQLMSRLEEGTSTFQQALGDLMYRIFKEHPLHSLNHLFAANAAKPQGNTSGDYAAWSRYKAAQGIATELNRDPRHKDLLARIFSVNHKYKALAENAPDVQKYGNKIRLKDFVQASKVAEMVPAKAVPPITITLALKASGDYSDAPVVTRFDQYCSVMGGISAPKMLKAYASDGKAYKELFKSGKDDLRQDAIMEQVFEEVSKMLRNHKATRQRDLKVRTYKVIPLAKTSGVIEFVPNSIPINDYLRPAHKRYHPHGFSDNKARDEIHKIFQSGGNFEQRLRTFQKVCANVHPVMRHFFFERFDDPDEWFQKRTAYTRTTASVSILGHILGLGDRHCSNILLDEQTGEVVHIDLGVAFEMGRVLPIPELIPFRLTRDIIDGMGSTGTEGVFRRCCEFTLDAVRDDKDSIMTLLNVLRYDPLYEWSVSPLRAKRMQEANESNRNGGMLDENSSKKEEQSAGEAERALAIVEKKLAKTLSTTATVNELIQQATDEKNLAVLFQGWAAFY